MPTLSATEAWVRDRYGTDVARELAALLERALYAVGPTGVLSVLRRVLLETAGTEGAEG